MPAPQNRKRRLIQADPTAGMTPGERAEFLRRQALALPTAQIGLTPRVINSLESLDVIYCHELVALEYDVLEHLGSRAVGEVLAAVKGVGLDLPTGWKKSKSPPKKKSKKRRRK